MTTKLRGTIIKVPGSDDGIISSHGTQYAFNVAGVWAAAVAPALNQTVEFAVADNDSRKVTQVSLVSKEQIAREGMEKMKGEALPVLDKIKNLIGLPVIIGVAVALVAFAFLNGWELTNVATLSLSQLTGVTLSAAGNDLTYHFTFKTLVCYVLILAPLSYPWIKGKIPFTHLVFAGPLIAWVLIFIGMKMQIHSLRAQAIAQAHQLSGMFGGGASSVMNQEADSIINKVVAAIHWDMGFYILLLAGLFLVTKARKPAI